MVSHLRNEAIKKEVTTGGELVTLIELGSWDGGETWTSGERLGSWPKVRLRVSEIVICE